MWLNVKENRSLTVKITWEQRKKKQKSGENKLQMETQWEKDGGEWVSINETMLLLVFHKPTSECILIYYAKWD